MALETIKDFKDVYQKVCDSTPYCDEQCLFYNACNGWVKDIYNIIIKLIENSKEEQ